MTLTAETLLEKLKEEGSFETYYRYLESLYGIPILITDSTLELEDGGSCTSTGINDQFAAEAIKRDLQHKSLERLSWIAEAEARYTDTPYLAALDRYHRLNPDTYTRKEDVQAEVQDFEEAGHNGKASFAYAPEHTHKDD